MTCGDSHTVPAGSVSRRIDSAVFVTSGRLTPEQRREAGEAKVVALEGRDELHRLASLHNIEPCELLVADDDASERAAVE